MSRFPLLSLLLAGTVLGAGQVGTAQAQTSGDPQAAPQAAETSSPGDIIVTARRSEERLQDVPISITVFNQEQINNRNIVSAGDLATYTPSLTSNTRYGADFASFAIRGFSQELRTTASVGTYFADVVVPRGGGSTQGGDVALPGSFFDLQNVQVLKGPQGTLFGRNTTGGAVLLVPRKPTDNLEGYVEGSYGSHDMRRLQGVVNVPVTDTFRVRAGVDMQKRDGYLKNISGIGPDRFANIDYIAGRVSVVGDLTPDLENYIVASYTRSSNNGALPHVTDCYPSVFPFGPLACNQIQRGAGRGFFTVENTVPDAFQKVEQWQVINTTTWAASDNLTVKNIASYAQVYNSQAVDLFGARYLVPPVLSNAAGTINIPTGAFAGRTLPFVLAQSAPGYGYSNQQSSVTEELQLQGKAMGGRLVWQAGGYFESSDPLDYYGNQNPLLLDCPDVANFQCTDVLAALLGQRSVGSINYQVAKARFQNIGVYAQGSFDLTEQLKLTAGIRYTWDKSKSAAQSITYRFFTPNVPTGFCTNALLGTAPIQQAKDCEQSFKVSTEAPTWVIDLDYKPIPDILLYAKYARGYRQGATAPFSAAGYNTFKQEKVDTYEVGTKVTLRGAISGIFNATAFYNDFSDQQLTLGAFSSQPGITPSQAIINAGKSRIYGAEVETTLNLFQGFSVSASYAYLNTKLKEITLPPVAPGSPYDILFSVTPQGSRLPLTPDHKLTATATYTLPLDESIGEVSVSGNYTYTSSAFFQSTTGAGLALINAGGNANEIFNIPSYEIVNFNVNWNRIAGSPIDAQFFMTNAFNEKYYTGRNIQPTSGFVSRYVGEPRMYGVRLRYSFGR